MPRTPRRAPAVRCAAEPRGTAVQFWVVDLRLLLGEESHSRSDFLVAVAVRADFRSGILIDAIEDVIDISMSAIKPPIATLTGATRDLVAGSIQYDGRTVSLLDIGKLAALISL